MATDPKIAGQMLHKLSEETKTTFYARPEPDDGRVFQLRVDSQGYIRIPAELLK